MMAYRLASELANEIAAVAVVSGSMNGKEKVPSRSLPVLIIHGLEDKHVPVEGGGGKLAKWGFDVHAKPLDYAVDFWVNANGCEPQPRVERHGAVESKVYSGATDDSEVMVYTIDGYAHSWPGGKRAWLLADRPCPQLSATDKCWEFFQKHSRKL